jgi:hypothetical protein
MFSGPSLVSASVRASPDAMPPLSPPPPPPCALTRNICCRPQHHQSSTWSTSLDLSRTDQKDRDTPGSRVTTTFEHHQTTHVHKQNREKSRRNCNVVKHTNDKDLKEMGWSSERYLTRGPETAQRPRAKRSRPGWPTSVDRLWILDVKENPRKNAICSWGGCCGSSCRSDSCSTSDLRGCVLRWPSPLYCSAECKMYELLR